MLRPDPVRVEASVQRPGNSAQRNKSEVKEYLVGVTIPWVRLCVGFCIQTCLLVLHSNDCSSIFWWNLKDFVYINIISSLKRGHVTPDLDAFYSTLVDCSLGFQFCVEWEC